MSMLALRVNKVDPNAAHSHGKKPKRVKGLWTVKVEPQQDAGDDMYYAWLYEGSQVMRKVYAALALLVVFTIVLYPLWPLKLRLGVYYLSWGFLGLLGLFFLMAIFRVILFCITYFAVSPGLWLYPNLWEDVSFMDSFRPVWAWHEVSSLPVLNPARRRAYANHRTFRPSPRRRRRRRAPPPASAAQRPSRASAPRQATRHPRAPPRRPRRPRSTRSQGSGGTRRPRSRRSRTSEPECCFFPGRGQAGGWGGKSFFVKFDSSRLLFSFLSSLMAFFEGREIEDDLPRLYLYVRVRICCSSADQDLFLWLGALDVRCWTLGLPDTARGLPYKWERMEAIVTLLEDVITGKARVHAACPWNKAGWTILSREPRPSPIAPPKPNSLKHTSFVTRSTSVDAHFRYKKPTALPPALVPAPFSSSSSRKNRASVRLPTQATRPSRDGVQWRSALRRAACRKTSRRAGRRRGCLRSLESCRPRRSRSCGTFPPRRCRTRCRSSEGR